MSSLRICIFGNTNNYPLLLAQGLRSLGHQVTLLVNRSELLHRPESRYPEWAGAYPNWIVDCAPLGDEDVAYGSQALDRVVGLLSHQTDLAVLNDTGPALSTYLNIPHAVMLTGSDLKYYGDFRSVGWRSAGWDPEFKRSTAGRRNIRKMTELVLRQRDGILGARVVCYPERGLIPEGDALLDEIGVQDVRRLMLYMSDASGIAERPAPVNSPKIILSGSRVLFQRSLHPAMSVMDFKGTDTLLKGYAKYCVSGGEARLRMPRKGQDIAAAEQLIQDLGIAHRVEWYSELDLNGFLAEVVSADLVCDQFSDSFPSMVTMAAMASGRPVMSNMRNEIFERCFGEPMPGFDVKSVDQVSHALHQLDRKPYLLADLGHRGRQFVDRHLSPEKMAAKFVKRFLACAG